MMPESHIRNIRARMLGVVTGLAAVTLAGFGFLTSADAAVASNEHSVVSAPQTASVEYRNSGPYLRAGFSGASAAVDFTNPTSEPVDFQVAVDSAVTNTTTAPYSFYDDAFTATLTAGQTVVVSIEGVEQTRYTFSSPTAGLSFGTLATSPVIEDVSVTGDGQGYDLFLNYIQLRPGGFTGTGNSGALFSKPYNDGVGYVSGRLPDDASQLVVPGFDGDPFEGSVSRHYDYPRTEELTISFIGTVVGCYDCIGNELLANAMLPAPDDTPTVTVTRITGVDRQDTAAKLSRATFAADVPVVYVATGGNFPDALSAAPAAAKQNGPLLLVDRDSMSQPVRDELLRLKPTRIVVVGSALSVSESVKGELARYATSGSVERIGGVDRYDTANKLVKSAFSTGSSQAWLATGEKFPDALAAGAAAGSVNAPVLLVNGGLSAADDTTKGLVSDLGVTKLTIAGSALSVSDGIKTSLPVSSSRIGGVDRYDTSVLLNRAAFTSATTVYLATGEKFPDALAGATAAGFTKNPLYTVKPNCVPQAVLDEIERLGASQIVLLGGASTLSDEVQALKSCG